MPDMEASWRTRKAPGATIVKKVEETLDAEIWGKLQDHIPLQTVYEKLPYEDLFRLRGLVCKAWNHSALQRLEPKPYFVTITAGYSEEHEIIYLNGIVNYDVASRAFSFRRQPFPLYHAAFRVPPFQVEGLIFCYHPDDMEQQGVFNVHTKTWHAVPPAPETSDFRWVCGLMVDTSERPYTFKLVVGSTDKNTQIYDSKSRSWSTTSSILLQSATDSIKSTRSYSCMCHNGCVYISLGQIMILVYSIEEDSWTTLDFPKFTQEADHNTLGVWEGRIFTTREVSEEHKITMWELVDPKKQEWVEFACCSQGEYDQLMEVDEDYLENHGNNIYDEMLLFSCFCDEYLLVCNWQYQHNRSDGLVLFNIKTKKWEKVALPMGLVATLGEGDEEMDDDEDVDAEDEVDAEDDVDYDEDVDCDEDFDDDGDVDDVDDVDDEE